MMDHVTYWAMLAGILLIAVAYWGWKNMSDRQKSAMGAGALRFPGLV